MTKAFKLTAEQIRPIAVGFGSCLASDRITVDGCPVGFMYREVPDDSVSSGWRFFSGDETQEYADDPANFALYDVNTIANYDPSITPFLEASPRSAFGRNAQGEFEHEDMPVDPDA
jgi:hypothetical protein